MVRSPFLSVAGAPALDFLNTEVVSGGAPADLLTDAEDLLRWLAESKLATPAALRTMRAAGGAALSTWFAESIRLRAAMRALFTRIAEGQETPRPADIRMLNDVLARTDGTISLTQAEENLRVQFQPREIDPPFLLARSAVDFLASSDLSLVRRCEGEGCILFFYDTTKSHTRRWCSMAACGNRTKVRAHYERKRDER